jgi:hypothetical protein
MNRQKDWKSYTNSDFDLKVWPYDRKVHFYAVKQNPEHFTNVIVTGSEYYGYPLYNMSYYESKQQWNDAKSPKFSGDINEEEALKLAIEWGIDCTN